MRLVVTVVGFWWMIIELTNKWTKTRYKVKKKDQIDTKKTDIDFKRVEPRSQALEGAKF